MEHVKFVSYDGRWPNLCTGTLVLNIDGKDYSFGFTTVPGMQKCDFPMFWHSGGGVSFDNDRNANVTSGRWQIDSLDLPIGVFLGVTAKTIIECYLYSIPLVVKLPKSAVAFIVDSIAMIIGYPIARKIENRVEI